MIRKNLPSLQIVVAMLLVLAAGALSAAQQQPMVSAGYFHSLALKSDGTIVAFGDDTYGQLGTGRTILSSLPLKVPGVSNIKLVSAGGGHVLALGQDGIVWAWGSNSSGQIGNGSVSTSSAPTAVKSLTGIVAIAAANQYSLALKYDGTVWAWGQNSAGLPWDGTTINHTLPVQVQGLSDAVAIAAGSYHSLALRRDGTVWAWGSNYFGTLGDGTNVDRRSPVQVQGLDQVIAIGAGGEFSIALKRDGTVWVWGWNHLGQLGIGTTVDQLVPAKVPGPPAGLLPPIQRIFVNGGEGYIQAIALDGSSWTWGGLRGDTLTTPQKITAVANAAELVPGAGYFLARLLDGTVVAWGYNGDGQFGNGRTDSYYSGTPVPVTGISNAVSIAAGYKFSLAVTGDGSVWAWGTNTVGQLGIGARTEVTVPTVVASMSQVVHISAGRGYSLAVKQDGTVWGWGELLTFLPVIRTPRYTSTPIQVPGLANVIAASAGNNHNLMLKRDGTVWACCSNQFGALGIANPDAYASTPVQVEGLVDITRIDAAEQINLAVDRGGSLWFWGRPQYYGPIVLPTRIPGLSGIIETAVQFQDGRILALKNDGTLWEFNWNTDNVATQVQGIDRVVAITLSAYWPCLYAVKSDGSLWGSAWGDVYYDLSANQWITKCDRSSPIQIIGTGFRAVDAGYSHILALKSDGSAWSRGANSSGQLGDGTLFFSPIPVNVVNETATGLLSLKPGVPLDPASQIFTFFLIARKSGNSLDSILSDLRATGFDGQIYFTGLLPSNSPLLSGGGHRAGSVGMVPGTFSRGGFKQTGPTVPADSNYSGAIATGSQYPVYEKSASDPLVNSNAVICMGITVPAWSAKGQVLMRPIATGDQVSGVVQCPTVQTEATTRIYTAQASGSLDFRTIVAQINPPDEDRGQPRQIFSWAVAPDGRQFMQTPQGWLPMTQPMQAAMTLTVPRSGPITVPVITQANLSALAGTLVYIGMGANWKEVQDFNKAGHYYTVQ